MEGINFKVTDDELIRFGKEFTGEGGFSYVTGKTIITKEEFIACYNKWVKPKRKKTKKTTKRVDGTDWDSFED